MMGMSHGLDLDVDDAADDQEADEHHEPADGEDDRRPAGSPSSSGGFSNIGSMNCGAMTVRMPTRPMGRPDDVAGHALLGGEGPDLALDAHALADGEGDRVEDLGEVAADLVLDV